MGEGVGVPAAPMAVVARVEPALVAQLVSENTANAAHRGPIELWG
jgi:hypothetical protein